MRHASGGSCADGGDLPARGQRTCVPTHGAAHLRGGADGHELVREHPPGRALGQRRSSRCRRGRRKGSLCPPCSSAAACTAKAVLRAASGCSSAVRSVVTSPSVESSPAPHDGRAGCRGRSPPRSRRGSAGGAPCLPREAGRRPGRHQRRGAAGFERDAERPARPTAPRWVRRGEGEEHVAFAGAQALSGSNEKGGRRGRSRVQEDAARRARSAASASARWSASATRIARSLLCDGRTEREARHGSAGGEKCVVGLAGRPPRPRADGEAGQRRSRRVSRTLPRELVRHWGQG